ncbi:uncharacterized protein [Amphiura filiformis]|uniref:uncharacterized protein n=1 Tax=Amphiura filiformis TaxID=82378 RepID=UPI003B21EB79
MHESSTTLGLKINIGKTEVQAITKKNTQINININGTPLAQVEEFTYLGGKICQSGSCTEDVKLRIGKAIGTGQKLHKIWSAKDIQRSTKIELYKVLTLSILLYGAETWTLKKEDENRLSTFEMMCLRKIMGVSRLDKIRNTTIRKTLDMEFTILDRISTKRLRYFGHIQRMPPSRFPKLAFEAHIHGKRPRGRPLKRWSDCLKADCNKVHISSLVSASRLAQDRRKWQDIMKQMAPLNPKLE